jgi:hypothetical protein
MSYSKNGDVRNEHISMFLAQAFFLPLLEGVACKLPLTKLLVDIKSNPRDFNI